MMLHRASRWNFLMLASLLLGGGWMLLSRYPPNAAGQEARTAPRTGFLAPDFTLDLLGGGQVTLSELRGQVVVLNLWASWCPPCRAEMPALERTYQAYQDQGVIILGVNSTIQDDEGQAAAFVQEYNLSFPIPLDRAGTVSEQYDLNGLPTTFFIDRQGVIRAVMVGGPLSEATLTSTIEQILGEAP
jgi:peroxiredoxin